MKPTRTIRRSVATAVVVPLAFAGLVAVAPSAGAFTSRTLSFTCDDTDHGPSLKVQLTIHLRDRNDNDIDSVTVRATDQDGTGSYATKGVDATSMEIKVISDGGNTNVDWKTTRFKKMLTFDPTDPNSGAEIHRVWAKVKFLTKKVKVTETCYFDFDSKL